MAVWTHSWFVAAGTRLWLHKSISEKNVPGDLRRGLWQWFDLRMCILLSHGPDALPSLRLRVEVAVNLKMSHTLGFSYSIESGCPNSSVSPLPLTSLPVWGNSFQSIMVIDLSGIFWITLSKNDKASITCSHPCPKEYECVKLYFQHPFYFASISSFSFGL